MGIDTKTPDSPGWWMARLSKKLRDREPLLADIFDRYEGDAPVPSSLRDAPDSARRFFKASRTNFAEMIVKAVKYPLRVQSVVTAVDGSEVGDDAAWRQFIASGMAEEIDDVHRISLTAGDSYAVIQQHRGQWRYTSEDPREVVTIHDPIVQSEVVAGAKFFHDDLAEKSRACLWRNGRVWWAEKPSKTGRGSSHFTANWEWTQDRGGADGLILAGLTADDPLPVFRYRNEEGVGEYKRHRDLLDRLDHMILQGMTIATLQAFKQRAIQIAPKDAPKRDPQTGEEINYDDIFSADPGKLWMLPDTAKIWESGNVDMTPVWTGMEKFIQQLSAVTFTPLAMFSPEGQNQSANGADFARESRTFKIEDRQDRLGMIHAKALAMLFKLNGDQERAHAEDVEIVWRPAERYSLSERTDALMKSTSIPWETRMTDIMQYTPQQVSRMKAQREDDALYALTAGADMDTASDDSTPPIDRESEDRSVSTRATALGALIRAGVRPQSAAHNTGFDSLDFWDNARPITIRDHGD